MSNCFFSSSRAREDISSFPTIDQLRQRLGAPRVVLHDFETIVSGATASRTAGVCLQVKADAPRGRHQESARRPLFGGTPR